MFEPPAAGSAVAGAPAVPLVALEPAAAIMAGAPAPDIAALPPAAASPGLPELPAPLASIAELPALLAVAALLPGVAVDDAEAPAAPLGIVPVPVVGVGVVLLGAELRPATDALAAAAVSVTLAPLGDWSAAELVVEVGEVGVLPQATRTLRAVM